MNRSDWEAQVFASNMNSNARITALVVGTFGNWKASKTVEPGMTKVSMMTDLSRSTVSGYVEAMVEQGWLNPVGTGEYNTTIYELCEVDAPVVGLLAKKPKKMNPNSTKNLNKGPKMAPIPHSIKVVGGSQLSNPSATTDVSVAEPNTVSCRTETGQLPNESESVAEPFDMNHTNNLYEPEVQPAADAAVAVRNPSDTYRHSCLIEGYEYMGTLNLSDFEDFSNPRETLSLDYLANSQGVAAFDSLANAGSRDAAPTPKETRMLTPGEKKTFDRLVQVHRVSEEQARQALAVITTGPSPEDFYTAVLEALHGVGAVSQELVEAW